MFHAMRTASQLRRINTGKQVCRIHTCLRALARNVVITNETQLLLTRDQDGCYICVCHILAIAMLTMVMSRACTRIVVFSHGALENVEGISPQ